MTVLWASYLAWTVFMVGWFAAAFWTGRGAGRAPLRVRIGYFAAFAVGFGLLFSARLPLGAQAMAGFAPLLLAGWTAPLWRTPFAAGLALLAAQLAGFGFAVWARLHLGRLWSGMLTLREGHRVVESGPYRWVRHPIYSGLILASAGLALVEASAAALAGAVVVAAVMAVKARYEEGFLRAELGAGAYDAYAARTPMLVPGLPTGR